MSREITYMQPKEIEKRSFELITKELNGRQFGKYEEPIIKRVIHTTADFEYADTLYFSKDVIDSALAAIYAGSDIVTDTTMALSGINKSTLAEFGGNVHCFIADEMVKKTALERKTTRSYVAVDKAAENKKIQIYVVGNAPTALIRIHELIKKGTITPSLVIGVPVGFVNVVEAKELFLTSSVPCIIARGRKGGSNVAAAIINALLYLGKQERGSKDDSAL